jgi:hypothetical protein
MPDEGLDESLDGGPDEGLDGGLDHVFGLLQANDRC